MILSFGVSGVGFDRRSSTEAQWSPAGRVRTLLQVGKVTKFKIFEWQPCGHKWEIDTDEESANEYMNKCLICEIEALLAEIKANNKTYRMAQDRANNDIETLTADIDEYQQQQDEIIVALGSKGILPSEIVSKVRSLLAEGRRWKELCASMLIHVEPGAGQRRADSYEDEYNDLVATQQDKTPVLPETEIQVESDGETDAADTRQKPKPGYNGPTGGSGGPPG